MRVQPVQTNYLKLQNTRLMRNTQCDYSPLKNENVDFKGLLPKGINGWDLVIAGVLGGATGGAGGIVYLAGKKAVYEATKHWGKPGSGGGGSDE